MARYAADEDRRLLGGTWWQWRQPCGDPHSLGGAPDADVVHLNRLGCPGDVDLGPVEPFQRVLGRGYPRVAPGRLDSLTSDFETGELAIEATAPEAGGQLIVWTPTSAATHEVTSEGLTDLIELEVEGGRLLSASVTAAGAYRLSVVP